MAAFPLFSNSSVLSEASFGFCGQIGTGMVSKNSVDPASLTAANASNRKWTVQELFGGSIGYTNYYGEGDETWYLAKTGDRGKGTPGWDDSKVQNRVKSVRTIDRCMFGGLRTSIFSWGFSIASLFVKAAGTFTSFLLSPNVICTTNGTSTGNCINLLGIIGGEGSNGGIIGSLRDSIFTPLATLAFLFTAMWVLYKGIIKREFRTSLAGLLWSIAIFVIGLMAMMKPQMLAAAPQTINSAISTCIMGAMNGQNCLNDQVTAPSSLVGEECRSSANAPNEGASLSANAMSCSIWKSFVLEGWTRGQFGRSYNDMYLSNPPSGGTVIPNAPKDTSPYGVALTSSGSANSFENKTIETSGTKINNLALYQLYISTNMKTNGDPLYNNDVNDKRWYRIITPVANNTDMWNRWAPTDGQLFNRAGVSLATAVISGAVAVSLILFAFWGLVYMFAGSLLMVFAPFFLLLAIEPSKGRKIFLGWLESVVSSILKFMASSLFVIVALTLYSAILSSTKNYATAFIGVSIMIGVLGMYRKEIINLLGMSNLGGQRFSNAVGDRIQKDTKKTKEFASIVGGSAVGGMIAARKSDEKGLKKYAAGAAGGAIEGGKRQVKRQQNMAGGIARQMDASNKAVKTRNAEMQKDIEKQAEIEERERLAREAQNTEQPTSNETGGSGTPNTGEGESTGEQVINRAQENKDEQSTRVDEQPTEGSIYQSETEPNENELPSTPKTVDEMQNRANQNRVQDPIAQPNGSNDHDLKLNTDRDEEPQRANDSVNPNVNPVNNGEQPKQGPQSAQSRLNRNTSNEKPVAPEQPVSPEYLDPNVSRNTNINQGDIKQSVNTGDFKQPPIEPTSGSNVAPPSGDITRSQPNGGSPVVPNGKPDFPNISNDEVKPPNFSESKPSPNAADDLKLPPLSGEVTSDIERKVNETNKKTVEELERQNRKVKDFNSKTDDPSDNTPKLPKL